jgi:hypothetical protein
MSKGVTKVEKIKERKKERRLQAPSESMYARTMEKQEDSPIHDGHRSF